MNVGIKVNYMNKSLQIFIHNAHWGNNKLAYVAKVKR